jgi:hypothetical protein
MQSETLPHRLLSVVFYSTCSLNNARKHTHTQGGEMMMKKISSLPLSLSAIFVEIS